MKIIKSIVVALAFASASAAFAEGFYVSVDGGRASNDYRNELEGAEYKKVDGFNVDVDGGYRFKTGLVLGAGFSEFINDNLFSFLDSYEFSQKRFYLGYNFRLATHLAVTPIVGYSAWELNIEESSIFNGDDNPAKQTYKGNQFYPQLNVEFPVNDFLTVFTSYQRAKFDFGTAKALNCGVMFNF